MSGVTHSAEIEKPASSGLFGKALVLQFVVGRAGFEPATNGLKVSWIAQRAGANATKYAKYVAIIEIRAMLIVTVASVFT